MNIRDQEEVLFDRWRKTSALLVRDGVVNPDSFVKSSQKLLYLLKEVNGTPKTADWCVRKHLRNGSCARTWSPIAQWTIGIRNLAEQFDWEDLRDITAEQRTTVLNDIAAMNLKKTPGGHTTNEVEFFPAVERNLDNLNEQFELYNPDLVICCGPAVTWGFSRFRRIDYPWKTCTCRGVPFYEFARGKFAVDFVHPEARVPKNLLFYGLVDAVREILERKGHPA